MIYDVDAAAVAAQEDIAVRLFPDGPTHAMAPISVTQLFEASTILTDMAARPGNGMLLSEGRAIMDILRQAFPTAAESGELDRIQPVQFFTLLRLVVDGSLPEALGTRTAEGNGCTAAAEASPSPSPVTPARSVKTPKKSRAGSKRASSS